MDFSQLDKFKSISIKLENDDGNGYIGTIFIGSELKPAKVLFDTGSDYLAVTSSLCNDPKLGYAEIESEPMLDPVSKTYARNTKKELPKCKS